MTESQFAITEHELSMFSPSNFQALLTRVVSCLNQDPSSHQAFLNKISLLISSKRFAPTKRFYALYLLFKVSEKKNLKLIYKLAQDTNLLSYIYRAAQSDFINKTPLDDRGANFFTSDPSKAQARRIGVNFVRLSLECFIYWCNNYGGEEYRPPWNNFSLKSSPFKGKLPVCTYFYFINREYALFQDLSVWNFYDRLPKIVEGKVNKVTGNDVKQEDKRCLKAEIEASSHEESLNMTGSDLKIVLTNYPKNKPISPHPFANQRSKQPEVQRSQVKKTTLIDMMKKWEQDNNNAGESNQNVVKEEKTVLSRSNTKRGSEVVSALQDDDQVFQRQQPIIFSQKDNTPSWSFHEQDKDNQKDPKPPEVKIEEGPEILTENLSQKFSSIPMGEENLTPTQDSIQKYISLINFPSPSRKTRDREQNIRPPIRAKVSQDKLASDLREIEKSIERSRSRASIHNISYVQEPKSQERSADILSKRSGSRTYTTNMSENQNRIRPSAVKNRLNFKGKVLWESLVKPGDGSHQNFDSSPGVASQGASHSPQKYKYKSLLSFSLIQNTRSDSTPGGFRGSSISGSHNDSRASPTKLASRATPISVYFDDSPQELIEPEVNQQALYRNKSSESRVTVPSTTVDNKDSLVDYGLRSKKRNDPFSKNQQNTGGSLEQQKKNKAISFNKNKPDEEIIDKGIVERQITRSRLGIATTKNDPIRNQKQIENRTENIQTTGYVKLIRLISASSNDQSSPSKLTNYGFDAGVCEIDESLEV